MNTLIPVFSDQLSTTLASISKAERSLDTILLFELHEECTYVSHHKKKIAFWFASTRHFAKELKNAGFKVIYYAYSPEQEHKSLKSLLEFYLSSGEFQQISITEPSEWRQLEIIKLLKKKHPKKINILVDDRFLCPIQDFSDWAKDKKQLRMEFFYREMRIKHKILMEGKKPVGGKWNYDSENRNPPIKGLKGPKRIAHKKDKITLEVLNLVERHFPNHFGDLQPFYYALTREQALIEARQFIDELLNSFGTYQDAMVQGEPYLYHSLLSTYLNAGLLLPIELCRMAEHAYYSGKVSLASAEGFIRQILGWREYVRGIYWLKMPEYKDLNYFAAKRKLPEFYWDGATKMNCMRNAILDTRQHAYSHHIQRLMITGNFALLAGIDPHEVCDWYLKVYSDAYDWVELPNTLGMALFADGGCMASKPYAASGNYINKMSNFCQNCQYNVKNSTEENACPFNYLYWNFIGANEKLLAANQRMVYPVAGWRKMSDEKRRALVRKAEKFLSELQGAKKK